LAAARSARAVGLPFQVNTLVAEETLGDLPAIYLRVADLGAARWSLFFLVSVGRGTQLGAVTPAESEDLMAWLATLAAPGGSGRTGPVVTTTEAPHFRRVMLQRRASRGPGHGAGIRDGNGIMFISHTGDVHPSGFLPVSAGNVRTASVVDLYRSSPLFVRLRDVAQLEGKCGQCEFAPLCGGSRARAYAATGNYLASDPLCPYRPMRQA
jgi:radical SAM protein with 4Fe4S-binding SPASM domain